MKPLTARPYLLLSLAAIGLALSFPTFHLFPLAWLMLAPLVRMSWAASPRQAALYFLFSGWLFHTVLLQWLAANIFWAGGWALIGQQLLCLLLGLFWALGGYAWRFTCLRLPRLPRAPVFALYWFAMEWLQATLFSGFGWSALGYTQGPNSFVLQWAALGGVSLISCVLALVNALLAQAWLTPARRWRPLAVAAGVAIVVHVVGYLMLGASGPPQFQVGLYQSNYSQEMKWDPEFTQVMMETAVDHTRLLAEAQPVDLLVWPEALVTEDYKANPHLLDLMRELTVSTGIPLFTGAVRFGPNGEDFNSSLLIDARGEVAAHYDKVHLAPFGEYVPRWIPLVDLVVPGGVTAGTGQRIIEVGERQMGPLICFEVLFSGMAVELRRRGAEFLVVITNLGWFGGSNALGQELEIARLRAVETRLPLVHCANTGISGVFDPYGRFQPINALIRGGQYHRLPQGLRPGRARLHRMVGALPVTAAAPHPFPLGPVAAPWLALALSLGLCGAALVWPTRASQP